MRARKCALRTNAHKNTHQKMEHCDSIVQNIMHVVESVATGWHTHSVLPPEPSALFPNSKIDSQAELSMILMLARETLGSKHCYNLEHLALHSRAMLQPMAEP
jgi:hypothetical protein